MSCIAATIPHVAILLTFGGARQRIIEPIWMLKVVRGTVVIEIE
jgi:hypothetical protein